MVNKKYIITVSLLPIYGGIFERLMFTSLYQFLEEHKLLSTHQTGFRCNAHVLTSFYLFSIPYTKLLMHTLLMMQEVFLDMPTAFDKILHKVFIHKLISIGVSGSLLKLIQSFLTKWFQKVLLNGQTSEWLPVKAGVFRGSILSSLFSVIYLSDLSERA